MKFFSCFGQIFFWVSKREVSKKKQAHVKFWHIAIKCKDVYRGSILFHFHIIICQCWCFGNSFSTILFHKLCWFNGLQQLCCLQNITRLIHNFNKPETNDKNSVEALASEERLQLVRVSTGLYALLHACNLDF